MPRLRELIRDPNDLIRMEADQLGGYVLEALLTSQQGDGFWNFHNFCTIAARSYVQPGEAPHAGVISACAEAWAWLNANGLVCPNPAGNEGWYQATRRAKKVWDRQGVRELIASLELPEHFLDPEIAFHARAPFLQGRFDTAVLEAFKTLEVEIRKAAGHGNSLIGVQLANRAFNIEDGPLTDRAAEKGEREALRSPMAGALGSYENSTSHRRVVLAASEAREMIMLASHLLQIIEARRGANR